MRREEGFTLVELLVVLVIAGLLLGGVYSMMIRQQKSYQTQDQVVEVQQNLRSTFILLRYDLRMIGHGLAAGTIPVTTPLNNQVLVNGTDTLTVLSNVGAASVAMPISTASSYSLTTGVPVTITVGSVEGFPTTTPYPVDLLDLSTGILVANANVTAVAQTTPPTLTLVPCPVTPCPATSLKFGSYVGQTAQTITYSVDVPGAASPDCTHPPCLERTIGGVVSVLAEGVEDFQVAYGFDTINPLIDPADGKISKWVYSAPGDTWPSDTSSLRAIRISLLLRTANQDPGYTGGTTGVLEDHTWTSPLDGYRRRVIQFIENVRNLSL
jgi:prepilin-type N-terminal cleavage/methylation domain-containing protein